MKLHKLFQLVQAEIILLRLRMQTGVQPQALLHPLLLTPCPSQLSQHPGRLLSVRVVRLHLQLVQTPVIYGQREQLLSPLQQVQVAIILLLLLKIQQVARQQV